MAQGKNKSLIIFGIVFLVYTLSLVSSVNIGVSPASIKFENVMRGGYAERYVTVSADSEASVEVSFKSWGDIENWIVLPNETISVSKGKPGQIKISVIPPIDIPNGNYTGYVKVQTSSISESIEDHAVGKIQSTLDLVVFVTVTDVELIDCEVSDIEIFSAEEGDPVILEMTILNKGNVRINPNVLVDIWDQSQSSILKSENLLGDSLMPTLKEDFQFKISSKDLDLGQYWSDISITQCLKEILLTFDILERGAMKSNGVLLNILSIGFSKKKEPVLFEANFKNIGEKQVSAQFKGQVMYNGKVVDLVESEKLDVPMGAVEGLQFYFTPEKDGRYVVVGRVYYDNKRTFESTANLDVKSGFSFLPILYAVFIFIVLMLIYKIRISRKNYIRRMRELR